MNQPVSFRPAEAAIGKRLKGFSGTAAARGIAAGSYAVLASLQLLKGVFPVLESLYYDGDASGTGYLRFAVVVDGYELPYDWARSYSTLGQNGVPAPIGEQLPPGRLLEIRCYNEHPTDSTLTAECDGEVRYYEKPL